MTSHPRMADGTGPSPSIVFDLLSHPRRHAVLEYLRTNGDEVELRKLVIHVALSETDADGTSISAETYERVYTTLYHNHLPRLAEAEVIDYDTGDERVARGPYADTVDRFLSAA